MSITHGRSLTHRPVFWIVLALLVDADEDGRIVLVNREIERLFGHAREELRFRSR